MSSTLNPILKINRTRQQIKIWPLMSYNTDPNKPCFKTQIIQLKQFQSTTKFLPNSPVIFEIGLEVQKHQGGGH